MEEGCESLAATSQPSQIFQNNRIIKVKNAKAVFLLKMPFGVWQKLNYCNKWEMPYGAPIWQKNAKFQTLFGRSMNGLTNILDCVGCI